MPTVDANLLVDDNGVTRPLRVSDLADSLLGVKLDALLAELVQKVEPGQAVALDATTLAALETIQVGNQPADPATQTTLEAVRLLLAGTPAVAPSTAGDVAATLTPGRKTVAVPGTAEAIRASLTCKWVQVTALKTNTQQVNVGGAGVLAAAGTSNGDPLNAGESVTYPVDNANKVFVDARVAGEGVSFTVGS